MIQKISAMQYREKGFLYFNKFGRSFEDEEQAIKNLSLAAQSQKLNGVELAECYIKIAEIYRDRVPKTKTGFINAILYYKQAIEIPCPSWFTPQTQAERLAMCPDLFGFPASFADKEFAKEMHSQNLRIQNGGDLVITATDWFGHLLERSDIRNEEYTNVGIDYLNHALKKGWDNLWTSILYTIYGRVYKFHMAKTEVNYKKAIDCFQQSINLNADARKSNQPWTIVARGTSRSYFELSELFSNPLRFGFSVKPDDVEGAKLFNKGIEHISKYGSLGPYGILEGMFVDHGRKAFFYKRGSEDMPTIIQLFELGKKLDNDKNGALHMFLAVAYHCTEDKSIEKYREIVSNYLTAFEAQHGDWVNERIFKFMGPLVMDPVSEGFSQEAIDDDLTKKAKQLMQKVAESPNKFKYCSNVKNIIDAVMKIYEISLKQKDDVMSNKLSKTNSMIGSAPSQELNEYAKQINESKVKLNEIFNDQIKSAFYCGIMKSCSQAFGLASSIASCEESKLEDINDAKRLSSSAALYLPVLGELIGETLKTMSEQMEKLREQDKPILSQNQFDDLLQDVAIEILDKKKKTV